MNNNENDSTNLHQLSLLWAVLLFLYTTERMMNGKDQGNAWSCWRRHTYTHVRLDMIVSISFVQAYIVSVMDDELYTLTLERLRYSTRR